MKYKTYIFDFDGTLVDSMPSWIGKIMYALKYCGVKYPDDVDRQAMHRYLLELEEEETLIRPFPPGILKR